VTEERLQKILSNAGVSSRRVAEELILAGRVSVNGKVVDTLGGRADTDSDEVMVDGVPVIRERYRYFMLNKPAGFITTTNDEMNRETVLDLVPIGDIQLHPVGRLDRDSEGLLLITNDGHITDLLTHPRYEVEKDYLVGIDSMPSQRDLQRLVRGIESEGERLSAKSAQPATPPEALRGEDAPGAASWLLLTLKEGRNREVRRMVEALGRTVLLLRRVRVGPLHLGTLGLGAFRELTDEEVESLYRAAKVAESHAGASETPDVAGPPRQGRTIASLGVPPAKRPARVVRRSGPK
jgi:23S rRNA pseudouridine2605 synthase